MYIGDTYEVTLLHYDPQPTDIAYPGCKVVDIQWPVVKFHLLGGQREMVVNLTSPSFVKAER